MFGGGGSIQLARISGIRIGVDPSWFFVLFLIIWLLGDDYSTIYDSTTAYVLSVASALLFFLSILLHELGHAVAARRSGIGITGIDLWMFGGVARLDRDTRSAGEEFKVAVAGPVVTLIIALRLLRCRRADRQRRARHSTRHSWKTRASNEALTVLGYLASINALLLVFNLIPAFPLDGGRIARAIAWWRTGDRGRATRMAARMGRGFSFVLIGGGIFLALQGLFITGDLVGDHRRSSSARPPARPSSSRRISERLGALLVSDVMDAEPVAIPADTTARPGRGRVLPALPLPVVPGGRRDRAVRRAGHPDERRGPAGGDPRGARPWPR